MAEHPGRNQGQESRPPQGQQISGQGSVGFGINRLKGDAGVDKEIMASDSQGSEGKQAVNPIDANRFGYSFPPGQDDFDDLRLRHALAHPLLLGISGQDGAVAIDDGEHSPGRHLGLGNQGIEVIEDHGGGNHPLHHAVVENRVSEMEGGLA